VRSCRQPAHPQVWRCAVAPAWTIVRTPRAAVGGFASACASPNGSDVPVRGTDLATVQGPQRQCEPDPYDDLGIIEPASRIESTPVEARPRSAASGGFADLPVVGPQVRVSQPISGRPKTVDEHGVTQRQRRGPAFDAGDDENIGGSDAGGPGAFDGEHATARRSFERLGSDHAGQAPRRRGQRSMACDQVDSAQQSPAVPGLRSDRCAGIPAAARRTWTPTTASAIFANHGCSVPGLDNAGFRSEAAPALRQGCAMASTWMRRSTFILKPYSLPALRPKSSRLKLPLASAPQ
jgi:hypothetical protein